MAVTEGAAYRVLNTDAEGLITSVTIAREPRHWHIKIHVRGKFAGLLTIDNSEGARFLDRLIPREKQRKEDL
jgi:hypothetical protein